MVLARLQGGPYDGAKDKIDEAGAEAFAWRCPECGEVHLTMPPLPSFLIRDLAPDKPLSYLLVKLDDSGALYRYGDLGDVPGSDRAEDLIAA